MKKSVKTLEFKFERMLPITPGEAFDAWLNPKTPGTPWYESDDLILNAKVGGLFYWLLGENPHYGRFIEMKRPHRIQNSWMSPSTLGQESTVTITFKKVGDETLMILIHSDLPNEEVAKNHERGWNYFLDKLTTNLGKKKSRRKK